MSALQAILNIFSSPRLFKIYTDGRAEINYEAGNLEKISDKIIITLYFLWNCGIYSSPILAVIIYKKGFVTTEHINYFTRLASGFGLIMAASYLLRALGRTTNNTYSTFTNVLTQAQQDLSSTNKKQLSKYEFEFFAWPVEFIANNSGSRKYISRPTRSRFSLDYLITVPCQILSYLIAHTLGIRLVYPGSIGILKYMMSPMLLQGRVRLLLEENGQRFKLETKDNNHLDAMFVDRRSSNSSNGNTLVICSEGNAGFYEVGIMVTPIQAGYSVLGWNHPGFADSTGMPYPTQELNAMDCVMQFAIEHLGFKPEQIILFGWSIGGFPTCWAAMNYPDVKGVILDATFDDVVPLAVLRMPATLEPIVRRTIREHINLVNSEQLVHYNGPISIIRRTLDEIICTDERELGTNRGNFLLIKLLKCRYPKLCDKDSLAILDEWLGTDPSGQDSYQATMGVDDNLCETTLMSYIEENGLSYPMRLGDEMTRELKNQMIIYLAQRYMKDYNSSHCTPLPTSLFQIPIHPGTSSSSSQTLMKNKY